MTPRFSACGKRSADYKQNSCHDPDSSGHWCPSMPPARAALGCEVTRTRLEPLRIREEKRSINRAQLTYKVVMYIRSASLLAALFLWNSPIPAAPNCPVPAYAAKTSGQMAEWYEKYVNPFKAIAGKTDGPLTNDQIEALKEGMDAFHHNVVGDPLFLEALVQQIAVSHARSPNFKGLDSSAAERIYKPGSGPNLDFSAMCIETRSTQSPDDSFAITLFGVNNSNCQHAGLRGLVFTESLINGGTSGECRPDYVSYKKLIFPVNLGTNTITFLCVKATNGCSR